VLHASTDWSGATLEHPREAVAVELLSAFAQEVSLQLPPTIHVDAHRWRYNATPMSLDRLVLFDPNFGIAVCGDWRAGGRVERFALMLRRQKTYFDTSGFWRTSPSRNVET